MPSRATVNVTVPRRCGVDPRARGAVAATGSRPQPAASRFPARSTQHDACLRLLRRGAGARIKPIVAAQAKTPGIVC